MNSGYCAPRIPVNLVCPSCRTRDATGRLRIVTLKQDGAADICGNCGTKYPSIDGIHCVPPDLDLFRRTQAAVLTPSWAGVGTEDEAARACEEYSREEPDSHDFREAQLPGLYALAHFPESLAGDLLYQELAPNAEIFRLLESWICIHRPPDTAGARCALDAGCGPGRQLHGLARLFPHGALGLDLRLGMLRVAQRLARRGEAYVPFRTEGRHFEPVRISAPGRPESGTIGFVQGDIVSPPFEAGIFPLVCACSLLDTVADPLFVLGQLDALVCGGGLLFLATPYHWETGATPADAWLSGDSGSASDTIRLALRGGHPFLPHVSYELLEEVPFVPFALPSHRRLVHRFFLDVILARKKG